MTEIDEIALFLAQQAGQPGLAAEEQQYLDGLLLAYLQGDAQPAIDRAATPIDDAPPTAGRIYGHNWASVA